MKNAEMVARTSTKIAGWLPWLPVLGLLFLGAQVTFPQAASAQPSPDGGDPLEQHVFSPELVMTHQASIGLSEDQRQGLIREVQGLQSDVVPLQFELSQQAEALAAILAGPRVDEARALELASAVTGLEAHVKKRHLTLLIRIKNLLSEEQQAKLRALR